MHTRRLIATLFALVLLPILAFSQHLQPSRIALAEKYGEFENPSNNLSHHDYFGAMAADMGLAQPSEMVLEKAFSGENGYVHYRFQQYLNGLPIIGSTYILHEKDGRVQRANGRYTPFANLHSTPAITTDRAVQIARSKMKAAEYGDEEPDIQLCWIDPTYPGLSEDLRLAYQVDMWSKVPFDKQRMYVDAVNGSLISTFPLIPQEGVPSTAVTRYYGTVSVVTDSTGPGSFLLRDPTRGGGIYVYDATYNIFSNSNSHWDLTNDDKDEVALDAHYCTTRYYDMMLEKFGWQGQDGQGKALKVTVHNNGAGNVNAFWDGEYSNYGDGNCVYGPLTTMEVIGHEFTHGMIDYTSKLVYAEESGAINESLADMFGKALEWYADHSNFSWVLSQFFFAQPRS